MKQTYFAFVDDQLDIEIVDGQIKPLLKPTENPQSAATDAGIHTDNPITPHPSNQEIKELSNETI